MKKLSYLLLPILLLTGCADDAVTPEEKTNDKLAGFWEIYSYKVNGEETYGSELVFATFLFTKESASFGSVKFSYRYDGSLTISQDTDQYQVIAAGSKLRIGTDELILVFSGSGFTLSGTVDSNYLVIKAN